MTQQHSRPALPEQGCAAGLFEQRLGFPAAAAAAPLPNSLHFYAMVTQNIDLMHKL